MGADRAASLSWVPLGGSALLLGCAAGRHLETSLVEREVRREPVIVDEGVELTAEIGDGVTVLARAQRAEVVQAHFEIEEWQERTSKIVIGKRRKLVATTAEVREVSRVPLVTGPVRWTGRLTVHGAESTTDWRADGTVQVVDGRVTHSGDLPTVPLQLETASVRLDAEVALTGTDEPGLYRALAGLALADASMGAETPLRQTWSYWYAPRRVRIALDDLLLPEVKADLFSSREPEPFVRLSIGSEVVGCTRVIGDDLPAGTYDIAAAFVGDVRRADPVRIDVLDADLKAHDLLLTWSHLGVPASGTAGWVVLEVGEPDDRATEGLGSCKKGLDQLFDALGVAASVVRGAQEVARCLQADVGRSTVGTLVYHLNPGAGDALEPALRWLDAQAWLAGSIPSTEETAAAHEILDVVNTNAMGASLGLCLFDSQVR